MYHGGNADAATCSRAAACRAESASIAHANPSTAADDGDFALIRHDDGRAHAEELEGWKLHGLRAGRW